ncbi:hypothetical protein C0Q70_20124 [Pomacea canaliculata]|uniref:Uncharacterized protein n=1 Tax=Pomacea canaliculata TaxID=400727 RepID=A0A2T7NEN4_POMCA|nr:hypothetical protein C0Q70_20124 [Pomacea canaliculata]
MLSESQDDNRGVCRPTAAICLHSPTSGCVPGVAMHHFDPTAAAFSHCCTHPQLLRFLTEQGSGGEVALTDRDVGDGWDEGGDNPWVLHLPLVLRVTCTEQDRK